MPWSPVPKFPEIIKDLIRSGYTIRVSFVPLHASVMKLTGIVKTETIKNTIKAMETLKYLQKTSIDGIDYWFVCQGEPGKFPKSAQKEEEKELEKY